MNKNTPNISPIEVVGHIDMIGTLLCMIHNGVTPPQEVLKSAVTVLSATRQSLAAQYGLPSTAVHQTQAYRDAVGANDLDF
jgi:Mn-containing catalase